MFQLLVFAHIALVFSAVSISYGPQLLLGLAIRTGRVEVVRGVTAAAGPLVIAIPILYIAGGLFGLIAAINSGINLLAPWLVIAYVLFVLLTIVGARLVGPWAEHVGKLAAAAPDGPFPPELRATITDSRMRVIRIADFALVFLLVFDMVLKPFS